MYSGNSSKWLVTLRHSERRVLTLRLALFPVQSRTPLQGMVLPFPLQLSLSQHTLPKAHPEVCFLRDSKSNRVDQKISCHRHHFGIWDTIRYKKKIANGAHTCLSSHIFCVIIQVTSLLHATVPPKLLLRKSFWRYSSHLSRTPSTRLYACKRYNVSN